MSASRTVQVSLVLASIFSVAACFAQEPADPVERSAEFDPDAPVVAAVEASKFFRVESVGADASEVTLTSELLCETIVRLRAIFGEQSVDGVLVGIDFVVRLHGKPMEHATEASARLDAGTRDGKYIAMLDILAPSAFGAAYRDVAGLPAGREHHGKVLGHEYATILLDRLTAAKASGWRFFAAPAWFVQGYEEYLGAVVLRPSHRDAVLAAFVRQQADPARVRFHPQLAATDPYVDGAALVHFLHEEFGGDRVRAVLDSTQSTFDEALVAGLGESMPRIEARWKVWRETALARADWQRALGDAKSPLAMAAAVAGRDLRRLPDNLRSIVVDALRELAGKKEYWRGLADGEPHRFLPVDAGAARWALVVTYPGLEVPGVSWMAVHLLDKTGKQIAVDNFPTGYRISLFDAWHERVAWLPAPVIVVRLGTIGSFGNFTYRQRQYYAVHEARVALVRIEEEGSAVASGSFAASHPWTGPAVLRRSSGEWIESLDNSDAAVVLETLTWLGGHHLASTEKRNANVNQESLEDSKMWEAVRSDARTIAKLAQLGKSPNRWVSEAAEYAVRTR